MIKTVVQADIPSSCAKLSRGLLEHGGIIVPILFLSSVVTEGLGVALVASLMSLFDWPPSQENGGFDCRGMAARERDL